MEDGGAIVRSRRRRRLEAQMKLNKIVNDCLEERIRGKSLQKGRDNNGGSSKRMRKAQSEAESFMPTLNYDVLLEVFVRLPDSQSTMRCALVCKHWFSVVSSIGFQTKKIQQHQESQSKFSPSTLIFRFDMVDGYGSKLRIDYQYFTEESQILHGITTDISISYLNFLPWPQVKVFSSCDDLLLVSPNSKDCWVICNPFTKQWLKLPSPPEDYYIQRFGWGGLVCKPKQQHFGFGFGRKLNEYKVILMRLLSKRHGHEHEHEHEHYTHVVATYSSESKEWSKLIFRFGHVRVWDDHPFASSDDGRIHWMMDGKRRITVFEPFKDTNARIIGTPLGARPALVASVRGRLWLPQLRFNKVRKVYALKVWELNDHGDSYSWDSYSWTLVKDVEFNIQPEFYSRLCILNVHPYDDTMIFLLRRDTFAIYEFYFAEEKLNEIGRLPPSPRKYSYMHFNACYILARPFWPTLLPI